MIEKIFIVFVIMEGFGLLLHIADSIRCWSDRIYYRKNQKNVQKRDEEIYKLNVESAEKLNVFNTQLNYICSYQSELNLRLNHVEYKLKIKKPTKETIKPKETK